MPAGTRSTQTRQGERLAHLHTQLYRVPPQPDAESGAMARCDEVDASVSADIFLRDHVARSRPTIFRGAVQHWTALTLWTNEFLR